MTYGFIGCGNMGGAIARALSQKTKDIILTDRSGKARYLAAELGAKYGSNRDAASCDAVFLGVKPHMMAGVLEPLQDIFAEKKPLLITMAAGLKLARIEEMAGCRLPIIRIMPNTPVAVGKGVIPYCCNDLVTKAQVADFKEKLSHAAIVDPLEERLLDAASALSGAGPAYAYIFLEAMADGAVACGIPRRQAMQYAAATLAGAGEMYLATGKHPGELKDAVCSPGGSTIAGIRELEKGALRSSVIECICTGFQKNIDLGKN